MRSWLAVPTIRHRAALFAFSLLAASLAGCGIFTDGDGERVPEVSVVPPVVVTVAPTATPPPAAAVTAAVPTQSPIPPQIPTTPPPAATTATATAEPTPDMPVRGRVGVVVLTRAVDSLQRPVDSTDVFLSAERVYVAVEFISVGAGAQIGITWLRQGEEIFTYQQPIDSNFTRGYFAFYLDPGEAAPGQYSAQVLIDGQVQRAVDFTISE